MQIAMTRSLRYLLLGFCVLGGTLSAVSLHDHYSTAASEYCDLNATFNCDLVNRSTYSSMFGVPVALIGILGYVLLFALSLRTGRRVAVVRLAAAVIGLAFALYLAYIEAYILAMWCLLCLGSLAAISAITLLSGAGVHQAWKLAVATPQAPVVRAGSGDSVGTQKNF
jgi:vitamin-K-epoxide reductase (warfarin-sensitive)